MLQPLCHAVRLPSFSCHKLTLRQEKESWHSHMIVWFQQLAPTNITWYHETRDNVVRVVSTAKKILISVTGQCSSAKAMSHTAYTPLVFCGNKKKLWPPAACRLELPMRKEERRVHFQGVSNRSHWPARHRLSRAEHMHMPPLTCWQGRFSSTHTPATSSLPLPAPPVQASARLQHEVGKGIDSG